MEINREDNSKYGTITFRIKGAAFNLEGCEILDVEKTKYGYRKVVVKLSEKRIDKMKDIEEEVNDVLTYHGFGPLKLVYGNKVYAKMGLSTARKHVDYIKLRGVFVNNEGKSFAQLWVM